MQPLYQDDSIKVFVYGTLKPGGHYWPQYCEGKIEKFVPAKAKGLLYELKVGYPGMTKATDCWVSGYLLTLKNAAVLDGFDQLEGFVPDREPKENEYNRELTEVYSLSGRLLSNGWVYYMSEAKVAELEGVIINRGFWNKSTFSGAVSQQAV